MPRDALLPLSAPVERRAKAVKARAEVSLGRAIRYAATSRCLQTAATLTATRRCLRHITPCQRIATERLLRRRLPRHAATPMPRRATPLTPLIIDGNRLR